MKCMCDVSMAYVLYSILMCGVSVLYLLFFFFLGGGGVGGVGREHLQAPHPGCKTT